jgi:hypothetical protein
MHNKGGIMPFFQLTCFIFKTTRRFSVKFGTGVLYRKFLGRIAFELLSVHSVTSTLCEAQMKLTDAL